MQKPTDRAAEILRHPEVVGREEQARLLAFRTDLPIPLVVEILAAGARTHDAAGAAAAASACVARVLLGLKPDPAADARIGESVAEAEAEASSRRVKEETAYVQDPEDLDADRAEIPIATDRAQKKPH